MKSIKEIVSRNLCVSCGACYAVCVKKAIKYGFRNGLYLPSVDDDLCSECGFCTKVCPSAEIKVNSSFDAWDNGKESECYVAASKDNVVRKKSASGGIVSSIVGYLLETDQYDYAYLLEYESFLGLAKLSKVDKTYDVLRSARSKYIPVSVESVIEDIRMKRIGRSIIVCTPCQKLAIDRAIKLYHSDSNQLFFIGLFCDMTMNYNFYEYFKCRYGNYKWLHFRDKETGGWPGDMVLGKENGVQQIDRQERMALKPYFMLNRCRYCFDKLNTLADISIGDCYIIGKQSSEGKSSVIVRTVTGKQVWERCKGLFDIEESSFEEIASSQHLDDKIENYCRNDERCAPYVISDDFCVPARAEGNCSGTWRTRMKMHVGKSMSNKFQYSVFTIVKKFMTMIDSISRSFYYNRFKKVVKRFCLLFSFHDKAKYVYINNHGFDNRGDQMMIDACVNEIRKRKPSYRIAVGDYFWKNAQTYCQERNLLLLQFPTNRIVGMLNRFVYKNVLGSNTYITPRQIDIILCAQGYAYGDKWNPTQETLNNDRRFFESFRKKGRKIYFLPQAFGPFGTEESKEQISFLYNLAEKMYPRDMLSMQYVSEVVGSHLKLKCAPDFTVSSYPARYSAVQLPEKQYITIILNARMMDKTDKTIANDYLNLFERIITHLEQLGEKVIMLNHEGKGDEDLMRKLNMRLNDPIPIITNINASDVKAIIRDSKLVISSRFHGVVSALVQGVPILCTSWSHKYEQLLKEHGCENGILEIADGDACIKKIDFALMNPNEFCSKPGSLERLCMLTTSMWEEILGK